MTECLFCLEGETPEAGSLITFDFNNYEFACQCKIHTHSNCWITFTIHKGRSECPICHKVFRTTVNQSHQIIHIQQTPTIVVITHDITQDRRCTTSKINCCVVILLLASIIGFIAIRQYA